MGGLLGGLLGVVHILGGHLLSILIGQRIAWRNSSGLRMIRVSFGSAFIGAVVGVILAVPFMFIETHNRTPFLDRLIGLSFLFALTGSGIGVICGLCLEAVRSIFEGD
jgi:ABC-type phosphate/phosphonate transport system permease subunit